MFTGACLCGGVRFRINGELAPIQVCHCRQCRKAQGTVFATKIPVRAEDFIVEQGEPLLREYASSPGKYRVFCGQCGSPIISKRDSKPDWVRVRAGTINEALTVRPAVHFYVASKAEWWDINDNLPQHASTYNSEE